MEKFVAEIRKKLNTEDPNYTQTKKRLNRIIEALDDVKYNPNILLEGTIEQTVLF